MTKQQHNNGLDTKDLTALFPASAIQWRAGATNDKDNPTEVWHYPTSTHGPSKNGSTRCVARKAGKTNIARPRRLYLSAVYSLRRGLDRQGGWGRHVGY